jgi:hypothetical protein
VILNNSPVPTQCSWNDDLESIAHTPSTRSASVPSVRSSPMPPPKTAVPSGQGQHTQGVVGTPRRNKRHQNTPSAEAIAEEAYTQRMENIRSMRRRIQQIEAKKEEQEAQARLEELERWDKDH